MSQPGGGGDGGGLRIFDNALVWLTIYYGAIVGVFWAVAAFAPGFTAALARERSRHAMAEADSISLSQVETVLGGGAPLSGELTLVAASSMAMALLMALPVTWVYGWTSTKKTYSRSFAQALLIFPIAVALVVFLVKGSLALAFSLAGIVAAVRFRSQLPQTRDAIFLFLVVGIGLAAGVQLLPIALIASVLFNFTMVCVAVTNFGAKPRRLHGFHLQRRARVAPTGDEISQGEEVGGSELSRGAE